MEASEHLLPSGGCRIVPRPTWSTLPRAQSAICDRLRRRHRRLCLVPLRSRDMLSFIGDVSYSYVAQCSSFCIGHSTRLSGYYPAHVVCYRTYGLLHLLYRIHLTEDILVSGASFHTAMVLVFFCFWTTCREAIFPDEKTSLTEA